MTVSSDLWRRRTRPNWLSESASLKLDRRQRKNIKGGKNSCYLTIRIRIMLDESLFATVPPPSKQLLRSDLQYITYNFWKPFMNTATHTLWVMPFLLSNSVLIKTMFVWDYWDGTVGKLRSCCVHSNEWIVQEPEIQFYLRESKRIFKFINQNSWNIEYIQWISEYGIR